MLLVPLPVELACCAGALVPYARSWVGVVWYGREQTYDLALAWRACFEVGCVLGGDDCAVPRVRETSAPSIVEFWVVGTHPSRPCSHASSSTPRSICAGVSSAGELAIPDHTKVLCTYVSDSSNW